MDFHKEVEDVLGDAIRESRRPLVQLCHRIEAAATANEKERILKVMEPLRKESAVVDMLYLKLQEEGLVE